jgi:Dihydrodipicolinate synthase/N-acetylneuraminate lyase
MNWNGVMPAITTSFDANLEVDHGFMAKHCRWLLDNGCTGIVTLGSLGEGATLSLAEKVQILRNCVAAVRGRAPVLASISALSTSEAVALAKESADAGCDGLMVLPPYVYQGDWREMKTHVAAGFPRHSPGLHLVQQSCCLRYRFPSRADSGIGRRTSEFGIGEGIEYGCQAGQRHSSSGR